MSPPPESSQSRLVPVKDEDGNIILYDMFVGDEWHGSRRTPNQCMQYFAQRGVSL